MARAAGRRAEAISNKPSSSKTTQRKLSKKRSALQGAGNRRLPVPQFYRFVKFTRFLGLQEMPYLRRRKSRKEQQQVVEFVDKVAPVKDPKEEGCAPRYFWRDPDANFCIICGDDKENHLERACPYTYLSPATYVPCRARYALWGNFTTTLRYKCPRHKEEEQRHPPPMHDETNERRLRFLQSLVRVNNLPERCDPEQLVALFSQFGPLRLWHVATRRSGACKGFGCLVFQHHKHAGKAIDALNCREFGDRKLRVDWAYPCLNC